MKLEREKLLFDLGVAEVEREKERWESAGEIEFEKPNEYGYAVET